MAGLPDGITSEDPVDEGVQEQGSDQVGDEFRGILISLPLDSPLNTKEQAILKNIDKKCGKKGFSFDTDGTCFSFFLQSLDVDAFKNCINTQIAQNPGDPDSHQRLVSLFSELTREIEGIRSYGIKGRKRIYGTYNDERKVRGRQQKVLKRGSYYYTAENGFSKETNDLPVTYRDVIIAGDSGQELKKLPSNCVDLVFTSPPYNFGLGYDTSEDGIDWEAYFSRLFAVFDECIRVLKYGGRIIVNIQPLFSDYIPSHHIISQYFMQKKLIWKGEVLWEKNNYNCKYTAWGSWKSPSNPYLKYTWEFLEIFAKGDLKKEGRKEAIDINADEFKRWVVAKWSIGTERRMKGFGHPAMFPEELVERVLKLFSYEGDIILDPFNGAGTTSAVAKKLNRSYIGIDISEVYCQTARRRISEML